MLFNSSIYILVFLPLVVFGYFLLNRQRFITAAITWLVLASLFFYHYWHAEYLFLLISSILVNYTLGTMLQQAGKKRVTQRKWSLPYTSLLVIGILFNLGLLGYFKYADFFIINFNQLFGLALPSPHLTLPLAISFFTFQQIAYLVDCNQKKEREYDFLHYCLFVSFFPQLIAGPIVHHQEMMPQFVKLRNKVFSWSNASLGTFIFSVGLFKKVWIADQFSVWVNKGFANNVGLTLFDAWGTSLCYTLQLYFDFSGYADMAIGSALFFNIVLPVNFNSPYKSADIQEFWRRWHMTLSRWLKEYLYIPLGGNRNGKARTMLNIFVTFVLAGLWHGAGWTFLIWGALHGVALVVHRLWKKSNMRLPAIFGWLLTFCFVNFSWVIFRAPNLNDGIHVLKGMLGLNGFCLSPALVKEIGGTDLIGQLVQSIGAGPIIFPEKMYWYLLCFILLVLLLPNTCQLGGLIPTQWTKKDLLESESCLQRFFDKSGRFFLAFHPNGFWAFFSALLFCASIYRLLRVAPTEFLYFNF